MAVTEQERQASLKRIAEINKRGNRAKPYYETWCYCSWCPHTPELIPHYRRDDCPDPSDYVRDQP